MLRKLILVSAILIFSLLFASCGGTSRDNPDASEVGEPGATNLESTSLPSPTSPSSSQEYRIVTLLPPDAIPAIDHPTFLTADEADSEYEPDELVIGVEFNGDARAYSIPFLSSHEIVNDTVGGVKIAITW